jgi:excisionase family DNA binding protein
MNERYLESYKYFVANGVEPLAAAAMASHAVEQREFLNSDELAEFVGVSRKMTDAAIQEGRIPFVAFGSRRMVRKSDLTKTQPQEQPKPKRRGRGLL